MLKESYWLKSTDGLSPEFETTYSDYFAYLWVYKFESGLGDLYMEDRWSFGVSRFIGCLSTAELNIRLLEYFPAELSAILA